MSTISKMSDDTWDHHSLSDMGMGFLIHVSSGMAISVGIAIKMQLMNIGLRESPVIFLQLFLLLNPIYKATVMNKKGKCEAPRWNDCYSNKLKRSWTGLVLAFRKRCISVWTMSFLVITYCYVERRAKIKDGILQVLWGWHDLSWIVGSSISICMRMVNIGLIPRMRQNLNYIQVRQN